MIILAILRKTINLILEIFADFKFNTLMDDLSIINANIFNVEYPSDSQIGLVPTKMTILIWMLVSDSIELKIKLNKPKYHQLMIHLTFLSRNEIFVTTLLKKR